MTIITGLVPFHCEAVTLAASVPDRNIKVSVNGADSSQSVLLNYGDTMVDISVCSADGTNSQVEDVTKKHLLLEDYYYYYYYNI